MTQSAFLRRANTSWKMRVFLFWKLPSAWFMGIRVRSCDVEKCVIELPYGWRSQNPFRSTYFAAQCAAGELSTGILALAHLQGKPPISMLVTHIEADFTKKAAETLTFTCFDGAGFQSAIQKALETGAAQIFQAESIATLPDGREAARVKITWSFRRK
ncbi:MAG: DUF4442 domain-containing protein [Saprospiraceae bacterium]|nr:DUF4442 domain-containing protein [Saprospiraceae bacterium]